MELFYREKDESNESGGMLKRFTTNDNNFTNGDWDDGTILSVKGRGKIAAKSNKK